MFMKRYLKKLGYLLPIYGGLRLYRACRKEAEEVMRLPERKRRIYTGVGAYMSVTYESLKIFGLVLCGLEVGHGSFPSLGLLPYLGASLSEFLMGEYQGKLLSAMRRRLRRKKVGSCKR
jgi:hypothetical protein